MRTPFFILSEKDMTRSLGYREMAEMTPARHRTLIPAG